MAYAPTRIKPAITPSTDAGQALDEFLDGEVVQLYTNDRYLDNRCDIITDNMVVPSGTIKHGTRAERLAYVGTFEATRWHETDHNTEFIYDVTTNKWQQQASIELAYFMGG